VTGRLAAILLVTLAVAACHTAGVAPAPPIVQPGAPGESSRVVRADARPAIRFTGADVRFMQGMIGHHAQALEMTALRPSRSSSDELRLLALRIDVSQTDEIKMMQGWLELRGQQVPSIHAMHEQGATLMPGMLTPDEMRRLADAKGPDFDRLFLEFMIKHHEGALIMVKELFATPGAGQEAEIFAFASDVEADQLIEIRRMRAMIAAGR